MKTLRFGILGAAKIAPPALIAPARELAGVEVVAVASRDRTRAEAFARDHGVSTVADDYADLVTRTDIDVVYNALPPSGHAPWAIRALEAGKHVLCEKPFCLGVEEAKRMVEASDRNDRVLCEAFHDRYHPLADRICEIVGSGELGELRQIDAEFTVAIPDTTDLRHQLELGGGATMDLGCYPLHQILMVGRSTGAEARAEVVHAEALEGTPGIDLEMRAELRLPGDVVAHMHCSMAADARFRSNLAIAGSRGTLTIKNPIHPHSPHIGNEVRLETQTRRASFSVAGRSTYHHQLEAFVDAIRRGRPLPTGGADAIETMRVIEDVYARAGLPRRGSAQPDRTGI